MLKRGSTVHVLQCNVKRFIVQCRSTTIRYQTEFTDLSLNLTPAFSRHSPLVSASLPTANNTCWTRNDGDSKLSWKLIFVGSQNHEPHTLKSFTQSRFHTIGIQLKQFFIETLHEIFLNYTHVHVIRKYY